MTALAGRVNSTVVPGRGTQRGALPHPGMTVTEQTWKPRDFFQTTSNSKAPALTGTASAAATVMLNAIFLGATAP